MQVAAPTDARRKYSAAAAPRPARLLPVSMARKTATGFDGPQDCSPKCREMEALNEA
jgi:hypothetical protein